MEGTKIKRVSKMGPRGRKKVNWAKRRSNDVKSVKKGVKDSLTANVYRYTAHKNLCFSIQPYFAAVLNSIERRYPDKMYPMKNRKRAFIFFA